MRRIAVFAAFATVAFAHATHAQGAVRLRLGTLVPQGSSYHRILQDMGQKWRTATNGQVQLTVYAGTMGSELELVRRMRAGQLQAGVVSTTGLANIDRGVAALQSIPMMYRTLDELDYVKAKLTPTLEQRFASKGFKVLFWTDGGWVRFFTREKIDRPDQLKKLKTFVTAGETQQFDLLKSAGYSPVALEWADALTSLQTKMLDAVPIAPYLGLTMQVYTVAGYMLDLNWAPVVGALAINQKTWDALSPTQRTALSSIAAATGKQFQTQARKEADEAIAAMQKRGLTVVPITGAALAEWRTASEQLYPKIRGTLVPADMFDQAAHLVTEYRSQRR
jgi:TRAP-type C4-dicarboxylate transport system substrate-binding protein